MDSYFKIDNFITLFNKTNKIYNNTNAITFVLYRKSVIGGVNIGDVQKNAQNCVTLSPVMNPAKKY